MYNRLIDCTRKLQRQSLKKRICFRIIMTAFLTFKVGDFKYYKVFTTL